MKKTLLTLFSISALFNFTNAQVSAYTFASSSGTYTAITGGTVLGDTTSDDERFVDPAALLGGTTTTGVGFPIGFNFTYNGLVFDKLAVNANGWISLGQGSLTPSVNIQSGSSYTPISATSTATPTLLRNRIAALSIDLIGQTGASLRLQTIGTAPNRVCVIQWTKFRKYQYSATIGDNFNFQIRLNETSNTVEIVYGTFTNNTTMGKVQVGLGGTTASEFNIRKTSSTWSGTTAGTLNTDTCRISATVKPASGQTFTWTVPAACTGTPTAGTATGPSGACTGVSFDLVLTGYTSGFSGIVLQWQSSPTGVTYSDIASANSATYTATLTAATYYRCKVTCSGGTPVYSNVLNIALNTGIYCYCAASNGGTSCIKNVTLNSTLNRSSAACENSPTYYTSVPVGTATTTINKGVSYPLSVTVDSSYAAILSVWIDYNQNGTFEASEWNQIATNALSGSTTTTSILIPSGATTGLTGMRIRSRNSGSANGSGDACTAMLSGETEDYLVTIGVGTACSGTPTAGTASASIDTVCSGVTFNLVLTGYTSGVSGLTFQWQSSTTSGGTYTNIAGATTTTYATTQSATTYYKCVVTCSGSSASSNIVAVLMNLPMNCFCTSASSSASDEEILNVTVGTLNNTSTCLTTGGSGSVLNKYSNYVSTVAAPNLSRTASIPFSVQIGTCGVIYETAFKIFIDYNQNGSFAEANERVYTSDTSSSVFTKTGTFTVPLTATLGNTLMRIICAETTDPSTIDSCGTYYYGETEDYKVNITAASGIEENTLSGISIYPNPTNGLFNITSSNANFTELVINVFDMQGKEVFNTTDRNNTSSYNKQINLEGLAKGIYYIKLNTDAGVKVQKLILQ